MRLLLLIMPLLWTAACGGPPARGVDDGTVHRFSFEGVVVRSDRARQAATIRHGPIRDSAGRLWMDAMTMEFPVPKAQDFARMKNGATIHATLCSRQSDLDYWVADVQVSPPSKAGVPTSQTSQ